MSSLPVLVRFQAGGIRIGLSAGKLVMHGGNYKKPFE
jgi:hypothetical protein